MIEIDTVKASNHHHHHHHNKPLPPSCYNNDDTDISEPDTALNTPTGSLTDSFARRYSSSSASSTYAAAPFKNYHTSQRKPSFTPKSPEFSPPPQYIIDTLEKKIQALENDVNEHVIREAGLQSQVLMLTEMQKGVPTRQYRSTLTRISKQIDQFLVTHENNNNKEDDSTSVKKKRRTNSSNSVCWNDNDWIGSEIPTLYGYNNTTDSNSTQQNHDNNNNGKMTDYSSTTTTIPMILIFRLKSMVDHFTLNNKNTTEMMKDSIIDNQHVQDFCTELYRTLNSWQEFYHTKLVEEKENKSHEQNQVTRLLEALHKSLLKNKLMKHDHDLLMKKYKADMKNLVNEVNMTKVMMINNSNDSKQQRQQRREEEELAEQKNRQDDLDIHKKNFSQTRAKLESQIKDLERELYNCQDERDEYETTLEMVRREMETMLEELEDTRQQRVRYKTQASRLRAGLEAIQKRRIKNNQSSDDEEDNSNNDEEDEDEGREAIRLMYNEAERQAIDLDRECKRQALTLNSIRQELKLTEEKYHSIKTEKNKELKNLQRINQKLTRDIEMLQVEKHELISLQQQQQQLSSSNSKASITTTNSSTINNDDDDNDEQQQHYFAKIYALQIALKAAKSDAIIQRTKISQLERQSSLADLSAGFVAGLQDLFQRELVASTAISKSNTKEEMKEMAEIIEMEQRLWKYESRKSFQKKYDVDLLRVNREMRFLTFRLNDAEDETIVLKTRHLEELSLLKYQSNAEFEKRLQQLTSSYRSKEQELQNQLEILFQKNQTLQDESLILYGRNMLMAHKLGKIEP